MRTKAGVFFPIIAVALLPFLAPATAQAQKSGFFHQEAEAASGDGNLAFLAAGVALPVLTHETDGHSEAIRSVDALGSSLVVTEILKNTTHEKRPDSSSHDSFPSGHATAAFAAAAVESRFYPGQAPYWFAGATIIAASRLQLNRHHLQDVLVGAGIGYGTAIMETSQRHGLLLAPFITPNGSGLTVTTSWK